MSGKLLPTLLPKPSDLSHPFKKGDRIRASIVPLVKRPVFLRATICHPIPEVADLYEGYLSGDPRVSRFFAHASLQSFDAEAALLLQWRATLSPESFGLDFGYAIQREGLGT